MLSLNGKKITDVYYGGKKITEAYYGAQKVFSSKTIAEALDVASAKTSQYNVVFAGSSTTQGYNQKKPDNYAHHMTARFVRHPLGAETTKMVYKTSGTAVSPSGSTGFNFLNVGLGGTTSANYIDSARKSLINGFSPRVVIHMIGSNDFQAGMTPEAYKANILSAIAGINAGVQHVLVHSYQREDVYNAAYSWNRYAEKLQEIAAEKSGVYFIDTSYEWANRRGTATDWLHADKIHCDYKGSEALADILANKMGLNTNAGKTIWAVKGSSQPASGATRTLLYEDSSLVKQNAVAPTTSVQPSISSDTLGKYLDFTASGLRHADVGAFPAQSFPATFYVVQKGFGSTGTTTQPWFSRSVSGDDGWWWAWRSNNGTDFMAAANSAYSPSFNYGVNNFPIVFAVHMKPNGRSFVWINSKTPRMELAADRPDESLGPWFKSLRLNANASASNYGSSQFYEMGFETGDLSVERVNAKVAQLGAAYGALLDP